MWMANDGVWMVHGWRMDDLGGTVGDQSLHPLLGRLPVFEIAPRAGNGNLEGLGEG